MLEFSSSNTAVMYGGNANTSAPTLSEFTIEIWICLVDKGSSVSELCASNQKFSRDRIVGSHAIFSASTSTGNFAITCKNGIQVEWDDEKFPTGINITEGVWTHLAVTWRNIDGRVKAMAFAHGKHQETTMVGMKIGKHFSFDGLLILGRYIRGYMMDNEYDMRGALDEFKVRRNLSLD